jgi:hypothetical protein
MYYFCYFLLIFTDISFTGWTGPSCNTAMSSGVSQAEEKARTSERALASPFFTKTIPVFLHFCILSEKTATNSLPQACEYKGKKCSARAPLGRPLPPSARPVQRPPSGRRERQVAAPAACSDRPPGGPLALRSLPSEPAPLSAEPQVGESVRNSELRIPDWNFFHPRILDPGSELSHPRTASKNL